MNKNLIKVFGLSVLGLVSLSSGYTMDDQESRTIVVPTKIFCLKYFQ